MLSVTFGDQVQKMENILNKLRDFSSKDNDIYEGENCEYNYFLFLLLCSFFFVHLKKGVPDKWNSCDQTISLISIAEAKEIKT